jgi:hypothetical protein
MPRLTVGPDAGSDDDERGVEPLAAGEFDALDRPAADHRGCPAPEQHPDAERVHLAHEVRAARGVELPLHERVDEVDDGDVGAVDLEAARGLESEQAAADDDGARGRPGAGDERARVVECAEDEHAVLVEAVNRRHPRGAARREEQRVVRRRRAVGGRDRLRGGVDVDDARPQAQVDAARAVPVERVEDDVVGGLLAGQHRREQHAVVVDVRLVAEDGDVEVGLVGEHVLEAGHAGHAVAHEDQPCTRRRSSHRRSGGMRDSSSNDRVRLDVERGRRSQRIAQADPALVKVSRDECGRRGRRRDEERGPWRARVPGATWRRRTLRIIADRPAVPQDFACDSVVGMSVKSDSFVGSAICPCGASAPHPRHARVIFFAMRWGPAYARAPASRPPKRYGASPPSLRSGARGVIFFSSVLACRLFPVYLTCLSLTGPLAPSSLPRPRG